MRVPLTAAPALAPAIDEQHEGGPGMAGALTQLEIGRRLRDRTELERAEAEFEEMGAAFDLGEARRLLGRELDPSTPREAAESAAR